MTQKTERGPDKRPRKRSRVIRPSMATVAKRDSSSRNVWAYCTQYVYEHGEMPSVARIAADVWLSTTAVKYHLRRLEDAGVLKQVPGKVNARRLEVWLLDGRVDGKPMTGGEMTCSLCGSHMPVGPYTTTADGKPLCELCVRGSSEEDAE